MSPMILLSGTLATVILGSLEYRGLSVQMSVRPIDFIIFVSQKIHKRVV